MFAMHHPDKRGIFFVAALFAALNLPAGADNSRDEQIDEHFAAADTNHDGQLTPAEAKAGMPRVAGNFDKIDADFKRTYAGPQLEAPRWTADHILRWLAANPGNARLAAHGFLQAAPG